MNKDDEYREFLFTYRFDGHDWGFSIMARDADEARERLKAMTWARYDGVLVARIPAGLGVFARLTVAIRNAVARRLGWQA